MSLNFIDFTAFMVEKVGYFGIFIGMFLESTIVPIPSELVIVPAGIAASKNLMDIKLVIAVGVMGNIAGAIFSYYLSMIYGKKFFEKFGEYFFVKPKNLEHIDKFFAKYGAISVFMGRLLPGFRHFISIPAGVAKMTMKKFVFYTFFGSAIWDTILAFTGFFIGENQQLIHKKLQEALFIILTFAISLMIFYIFRKPALK